MALKHNFPQAYNRMGDLLFFGRGVKKDLIKAYEYYMEAALSCEVSEEVAYSYFCCGKMRYYGEGVQRDYDIAFEFFKKSLDATDLGLAHLYLGKCYIYGYGVEQNIKQGYEELLKAQALGSIDDENLLDMLVVDMDGNVGFKN